MTQRIEVSIVVGAALIASAIFLQPKPDVARYSMSTDDVGTDRLDLQTGEIVHCNMGVCVTVVAAGGKFPLNRKNSN